MRAPLVERKENTAIWAMLVGALLYTCPFDYGKWKLLHFSCRFLQSHKLIAAPAIQNSRFLMFVETRASRAHNRGLKSSKSELSTHGMYCAVLMTTCKHTVSTVPNKPLARSIYAVFFWLGLSRYLNFLFYIASKSEATTDRHKPARMCTYFHAILCCQQLFSRL